LTLLITHSKAMLKNSGGKFSPLFQIIMINKYVSLYGPYYRFSLSTWVYKIQRECWTVSYWYSSFYRYL